MLIGGDYGIAFMPNGTNANDIQHFIDYLGFSPVEALRAATFNGGQAMGLGAGEIREGALADILLVKGDPTVQPRSRCRQGKPARHHEGRANLLTWAVSPVR
ncbi:amidohydrolase family protein [Novosphingobium colocasiae]